MSVNLQAAWELLKRAESSFDMGIRDLVRSFPSELPNPLSPKLQGSKS